MIADTKTIILPLTGKGVEVKGYITGKDGREIESVFFKNKDGIKVNADTKDIDFQGATADLLYESNDVAIKKIVISIEGVKTKSEDEILKEVLDLPKSDYEFLLAEITKKTSGETEEVKKN